MAWYNPVSWFNSATYENVGGKHVYTLTNPDTGKFLSAFRDGHSELSYLRAFLHVPEVFAVYDAIASRAMNGRYYIRRKSDGADVTHSKTHLKKLLEQPNPFTKGDDFRYTMIIYKLVCGNRYTYKKISPFLNESVYTSVASLWQLRPWETEIELKRTRPNLFDCKSTGDFVENYITYEDGRRLELKPMYVKHDTDIAITAESLEGTGDQLKGISSMRAAEYPISNLCAVYEARNIIYVKRGPLGAIISRRKDNSGTVALTPKEKAQLRQDLNAVYGVTGGRSPVAVVAGEDLDYVKFGSNIAELLPFEETRASMYAIAMTQGVPRSVLPSEKGSTFSNQKDEERGLYTNRVIPEAQELCDVYNELLGLTNEPFEVAVSFDHVEVMQENRKDAAAAEKTETETAILKYEKGAITKNEMRVEMGEKPVPGEDYYVIDDPQRQQNERKNQTTPQPNSGDTVQ